VATAAQTAATSNLLDCESPTAVSVASSTGRKTTGVPSAGQGKEAGARHTTYRYGWIDSHVERGREGGRARGRAREREREGERECPPPARGRRQAQGTTPIDIDG